MPLERRERERAAARSDGGGPGRIVTRRPRRRWGWKRRRAARRSASSCSCWSSGRASAIARVSSGVGAAHQRLPQGTSDALAPGGLLLSSPTNILLLGTDHSANANAGRGTDQHSDSMMLLRTDPGRHRLIYLSIPRDLRASIPGYGDQKINAAMQIGGPTLAIRTVDRLFGDALRINHVVVVDFGAFQELIDAVGGIDVNVPENILSNRFDCPFPASRCALLEGLALPQGRPAHGRAPGADLLAHPREPARPLLDGHARAGQNQQQVMQATMSKLASASTFFRLPFDGRS